MANTLHNLNNEVLYISIFKQEKFFGLNKGIKFIEPKNKMNTRRLELLKTIFWIRKEIRTYKPDTILVFNNFYSSIVLLSLAFTDFSIFISDRASPLFVWPKHIKIFNQIIFRLFPPNGVIAQTTIAKEHQLKIFKKRIPIKVIPNILREMKSYDINKKNQILAVGRLGDYLKGFDRLIEAFAKINTDWELAFAGGDEDGEYLKEQAKKLNVLDKIKFLGKVKDIDKVYSESKIFVIPSRSEGFPNALCEAMAFGLACVSFNFIAGPADLIEDGINGIIVEDGNINMLASKIQFLIDNEEERNKLGNEALQIKNKLNSNIIGREVYDFITG
ncbi:MAG: glycosyltransferase [Ignavibacteriae bacterium]|nr:glycosyltransferase [Ignavibacteriota bacterium]